jgi:hypothetical protein
MKPKTILRKAAAGVHLTTLELADRLKMCPGSLANWRRQGKGPKYIKFGSKVLYPMEEIKAWEKEHMH